MINFNGAIQDSNLQLSVTNRSFLYGDGIFETLKVVDHKILFFEEHYFRLMASMRIVRMEIPMFFTMEYLEEQILKLLLAEKLTTAARVRLSVFRNEGGFYTPQQNSVSFVIQAMELPSQHYQFTQGAFEVDLYKDAAVSKQLLSTIKTTSKVIHVLAGIFAKENQLDSCLLINEAKNVIEGVNGNLFMFIDNKLVTPPISEGCLNGVMRKQILEVAKSMEGIVAEEAPISPFDLQKADELFLTNVITGIQPITKYRKKEFEVNLSKQLLVKLNEMLKI